jgi:hypothetical protein
MCLVACLSFQLNKVVSTTGGKKKERVYKYNFFCVVFLRILVHEGREGLRTEQEQKKIKKEHEQ